MFWTNTQTNSYFINIDKRYFYQLKFSIKSKKWNFNGREIGVESQVRIKHPFSVKILLILDGQLNQVDGLSSFYNLGFKKFNSLLHYFKVHNYRGFKRTEIKELFSFLGCFDRVHNHRNGKLVCDGKWPGVELSQIIFEQYSIGLFDYKQVGNTPSNLPLS